MSSRVTAPYGTWRSPITASWAARGSVRLGELRRDTGATWWIENRPAEQGRAVVVRASDGEPPRDVTPPGFDVRTRVHEYGGGAYILHQGTIFFSHFPDQRLYQQDPGRDPIPITPEPPLPAGLRYADGRVAPGGRFIVAVRERHEADGSVTNELVTIPTDASAAPRVIATGRDFYAAPRISPDGRRLCWLCWDHSAMPWDGTELWLAELAEDGSIGQARQLAGGPGESITQPQWGPNGELYFLSDRTGWWNPYRWQDGSEPQAVVSLEAEFGEPHWTFGQSRYAVLPDGRLVCAICEQGVDRLVVVERDGRLSRLEVPWQAIWMVVGDPARGDRVWLIAGAPSLPASVVELDLASGQWTTLCQSVTDPLSPEWISSPEPLVFPTDGGREAYAFYYPPTNPEFRAPPDERPPLLVFCHGGPTGHVRPDYNVGIQFWTSRGFAVVNVNYGGSTGYGRAYRERLKREWGIVDVRDCLNAARYLASNGLVHPWRMAIRGGSAGGYTVLCALTFHRVFAAGTSYFGLSDLEAFVRSTHKFESRYLDGLVGPYPEAQEVYRERSPVHFAHRIEASLLLLQGSEDRVVPPEQAELMVQALRARRRPYAYLLFPGEGHGFRGAETLQRCFEAELSFYAQVFGFTPADQIEPIRIENFASGRVEP